MGPKVTVQPQYYQNSLILERLVISIRLQFLVNMSGIKSSSTVGKSGSKSHVHFPFMTLKVFARTDFMCSKHIWSILIRHQYWSIVQFVLLLWWC
jgi:hypothetical protein